MKLIHYPVFAMLALGAFVPSLAQAQTGSRLCGHVAIETPSKIGLLYEAKEEDNNYREQCDKAIQETKDSINSNAQLKTMKWKKIERSKCEDVGNMGFTNPGQSPDMCDNMQAKQIYKVMKESKANATYEKQ